MLLNMYIEENEALREKYVEHKVAVDMSLKFAEKALERITEAVAKLLESGLTDANEELYKDLISTRYNLEIVTDNLKVGDNK